jgi:S-adenosylmethionine hydrolase
VKRARIVTLLTDFGLSDPYVGILKGVVLGIAPEARIVDLTHDVPPQDVLTGALLLERSARWFPEGTIHLAVVDPGVGSKRRAIAIACRDRTFVGPDNGLLGFAAARHGVVRVVELANPAFRLREVSSTFHGRDVFAPAAAHLAAGVPIERLGPRLRRFERPRWPFPRVAARRTTGRVVLVDRFGNLVTNVEREHLPRGKIAVSIGPFRATRILSTYEDVARGELLAIFGSFGLLEIAARDGSAAKALGLGIGAKVVVEAVAR